MRRSTLSTTNEQLPGDASSSVSPLMPLPCSSAPSSVPSRPSLRKWLGQALLLAAAVVEVMGLLVAIERTAAIALESSKSLNFKARNNQEMPLP